MRNCTLTLGTGVKAETIHVDKLRIVGYPTMGEQGGNKSASAEPGGRKIKKEMKKEVK